MNPEVLQLVPQILDTAIDAVKVAEELEHEVVRLRKHSEEQPVVRLEKVAAEELVSNLVRAGFVEPSNRERAVSGFQDNPLLAAVYLNKMASVIAAEPASSGVGISKQSSTSVASGRAEADRLWAEACAGRG